MNNFFSSSSHVKTGEGKQKKKAKGQEMSENQVSSAGGDINRAVIMNAVGDPTTEEDRETALGDLAQ